MTHNESHLLEKQREKLKALIKKKRKENAKTKDDKHTEISTGKRIVSSVFSE